MQRCDYSTSLVGFGGAGNAECRAHAGEPVRSAEFSQGIILFYFILQKVILF